MTTWEQRHMRRAYDAAKDSKCPTKVGAVLFDEETNVQLLTGYNGIPMQLEDVTEYMRRPQNAHRVAHAEMNLIAFAARYGVLTQNRTIATTHAPCSICTRLIIQAGIKAVWYCEEVDGHDRELSQHVLKLAGIPAYKMEKPSDFR